MFTNDNDEHVMLPNIVGQHDTATEPSRRACSCSPTNKYLFDYVHQHVYQRLSRGGCSASRYMHAPVRIAQVGEVSVLVRVLITQDFRTPDQRLPGIAPRMAHDTAEKLQHVPHMHGYRLGPTLGGHPHFSPHCLWVCGEPFLRVTELVRPKVPVLDHVPANMLPDLRADLAAGQLF